MIRLTLPITPLLNRYYRKFRNMIVLSAEAKAYKAEVALICQQAGVTPLEGEVLFVAHVYRARKSGDLDSYLKGLWDSLQGYAYLNDKQIVDLRLTRHDDKHNPRVEIEITELVTPKLI